MYEEIVDSDNPSVEEVRKKLRTEYYTPSESVSLIEQEQYNPGIEIYKEDHSWTDSGWSNVSDTEVLLRCSEYLPSDQGLNHLTRIDQIVEIGAGNGYWSHVINENGGCCLPTDINPEDVPYDELPDDYYETSSPVSQSLNVERPFYDNCDSFPCEFLSRDDKSSIVWSEVKFANHNYVSETDAEYILLCHPVKFDWVEDLLDLMIEQEQKLILIAQWEPGPDATPQFFLRLDRNWNLKHDFPVIDWSSMHAHGYVFEPPKNNYYSESL